MTPLDISGALAAERTRDLRHAAHASRLAALARGCRSAAWPRAASRAVTVIARVTPAMRRSQLGPANNLCAAVTTASAPAGPPVRVRDAAGGFRSVTESRS
jgi:hypothetical protein